MSEPALNDLPDIWRQLARRNDWELVTDEQEFLRRAAIEFESLAEEAASDQRARVALLRTYGALLYNGLRDRQDRAAYEIWLACYRLALRDKWPPPQAEINELIYTAIELVIAERRSRNLGND